MVKLRLTRTGRKNFATYRVIAVDSRSKRDGKAIEELGYYLPHDKQVSLNKERIQYWLSVGAQPSSTVARLLVKDGLMKADDLQTKTFKGALGRKAKDRAAKREEKAEAARQAASKPAEPVVEEAPAEEPAAAAEETPAVAEAADTETPAAATE